MPQGETFDDTFVCIPRSLAYEVLEGRLDAREAYVLLWLFLRANWRNGLVHISYAGLAEELDYNFKDKVNAATKVIHSLQRKGCIRFEKRQGKKGSFPIRVTNYLTPGALRSLRQKRKVSFSQTALKENDTGGGDLGAEDLAELFTFRQKSDANFELITGQELANRNHASRSTNNDKNNKNNNELSVQRREEKTYGLVQYEDDYIRQRCEEIANDLGEDSLAYTLSACQKFGLDVVEEAYKYTLKRAAEIEIRNLGAFFNKVVRELGAAEMERRRTYYL